jgi:fructose-1,6-bisphosphatase
VLSTYCKQLSKNYARWKNPILNQQANDNLWKTLEAFIKDIPKDFSIFDKIIQNRFVQNLY